MKMALQDGIIKIIEADNVQFTIIKSWNKMKWDKKNKMLTGLADIELLDKLAGIVRLPQAIDTYRGRLHRVQDAVDRERMDPEPEPLYKFPVKMNLYRHQTRGANMALLTFGLIEPEQVNHE